MSPRWEPNNDIRRGRSAAWNLHAHLVFVTKYRRGAPTRPILDRCQQIMADVCRDFNATLVEFSGEEDHVHLMIHFPPTVELSKLVNSLKGVSSRLLRKEFWKHLKHFLWGDRLWSPSYFAASCGGAPLEIVKQYIENQKLPPS